MTKHYPVVENDLVVNIIVAADDATALALGATVVPEPFGIGWTWDGEAFNAPPEPEVGPVE